MGYLKGILEGESTTKTEEDFFVDLRIRSTLTMHEGLTALSMVLEIRNALDDMDDNSALGRDGYTTMFFKDSWDVIGSDIGKAIIYMFLRSRIPRGVNSFIFLIPKISNPSNVSDFRSTPCCNVIYKCLSNVLTNKLKSVIDKVVQSSQVAFLLHRDIQDNLLLAHSLIRGSSRKIISSRCVIKVEIQKAYDTVNWKSIELVLVRFGFPPLLFSWISMCFQSSQFSININGSLHGYFPGKRGLRLRDPLSP